MTNKAWKNAVLAEGYIVLVSMVMYFGGQAAPKQDTFFAPIAVLSLFTVSTAVMVYLFGYRPWVLYFDGKKKEAVELFLQTVGFFGVMTAAALMILFFWR